MWTTISAWQVGEQIYSLAFVSIGKFYITGTPIPE